jgi:5-methylcytosine-specific restriction endonuclease McrA
MPFTNDKLNDIYDRSSGCCHICHRRLSFKNYGAFGERGAWEVEHSNPRIKGGTDRLSNLYPACISCNRSKGAASTRYARALNGLVRAPLSYSRREQSKIDNAIVGAVLGGILARALNPQAVVLGSILGMAVGHGINPER